MAIKCLCGMRMNCTDTRQSVEAVRRRYKCKCGALATTKEVVTARDEAVSTAGNPKRPHTILLPFKTTTRKKILVPMEAVK